jgi:hypothetical protein
LLVPEPTTSRSLDVGMLTRAVLANSVAVVSVAGGLLYGLIALSYDRFYRTLGVSAEDVGISQSEIVARTAVALALFTSVLVGVYVLVFAVLSWLLHRADVVTVALASVAVVAGLGPVTLRLTVAPVLFARGFVGAGSKLIEPPKL